jgi:tRNA-Thr(GGU) m(6)t(6)A37 methyltransferase TsaA
VARVRPSFCDAVDGIAGGDELFVLTWLQRADRSVLRVHPRDDPTNPEQGVFITRSADRANPVGLHRVTVTSIDGLRLQVRDLEAVDGTPIIDVKPPLRGSGGALRRAASFARGGAARRRYAL